MADMDGLLLVASAFFHALWNALAKKSLEPSLQVMGILVFASIFTLVFTAIVSFFTVPFFDGPAFPGSPSLMWAIFSGLFEAGYFITLSLALTKSPMGTAYIIMRGGAMLLVYLISGFLLGEKFNLLIGSGVLVVLAGLYFSSSTKAASNTPPASYFWAYVCAIFIGGYHLCYSRSLVHGANAASLFTVSLVIALPVLLVYNGKKKIALMRDMFMLKPSAMMFAGFICTFSFMLYLLGLHHSGAGLALTVRNSSIIFAQFFAIMIGENVGGAQWAGAILVAVGASMVSLG